MAKLSDRNKNLTFVPSPQSPDSAGFVKETADDVVPDGWLECNGQVVEQADYPELFEKIGTTYNTGGETGTQFRLPGGSLLTNASVDGTLDVSGNTTMSGTLDVAGDVEIVTSDLVVDTNTLVTSGGSVGIGTASPSTHEAGTALNVESSTGGELILRRQDSTLNPGDFIGGFVVDTTDASNATPQITGWRASAFTALGEHNWSLYTKFNEYETVSSTPTIFASGTGSVGIGTSSPSTALEVSGAFKAISSGTSSQPTAEILGTTSSNSRIMNIIQSGHNTVNGTFINFATTSGNIGSIFRTSGGVSYSQVSDARLKTNFSEFNALAMVEGMSPLLYDRVDPTTQEITYTGEYGFVAQELHAVFPQAVVVGGDDPKEDPWQVDYGSLTSVLCKAIQELKEENDALKARVDALEAP